MISLRPRSGRTECGPAASKSCNAMLSLETDDQKLFLRASMSMMGDNRYKPLSFEDAAEDSWAMLVAPLQR